MVSVIGAPKLTEVTHSQHAEIGGRQDGETGEAEAPLLVQPQLPMPPLLPP